MGLVGHLEFDCKDSKKGLMGVMQSDLYVKNNTFCDEHQVLCTSVESLYHYMAHLELILHCMLTNWNLLMNQ